MGTPQRRCSAAGVPVVSRAHAPACNVAPYRSGVKSPGQEERANEPRLTLPSLPGWRMVGAQDAAGQSGPERGEGPDSAILLSAVASDSLSRRPSGGTILRTA